MFETQLVFRNEYRLDLKKVESILIPYLFDNDTSLIASVEATSSRNYRSVGRVDQIAIDYPGKLIASSQILRFGNQQLYFPQRGRFKLEFYPNYYLGKTRITLQKIAQPLTDIDSTLQRIEQKIDDISDYGGS